MDLTWNPYTSHDEILDLKNAELALERARQQGAKNLAPLEKALEKALARKQLAKAQHDGRA